jgi:uncharacterized membrane protein YhiD involved in acid resistance
LLTLSLRLVVAAPAGALPGLQQEMKRVPASLRTHMLGMGRLWPAVLAFCLLALSNIDANITDAKTHAAHEMVEAQPG